MSINTTQRPRKNQQFKDNSVTTAPYVQNHGSNGHVEISDHI